MTVRTPSLNIKPRNFFSNMADTEPIFQRKLKRIAAPSSPENEFSLVSYNILCDHVFEDGSARYPHLSEELKCRGPDPYTAPRHIQLIKELRWLNGDIVCLQEVDPFYFAYLVEELEVLGYEGVYRAHDAEHGLATFFRTARFAMNKSEAYGFIDLLGDLSDDEQFKESNRHNQRHAQFTTLQDLRTGKDVVIVNVHLIFQFFQEPDAHALQIALFLQQLYKTLPQSSKHTSPWIVCGDFNMRPDFPVYEMVRNGRLSVESVEKLNPAKWKHPELTKQTEIVNYDSVVLQKHKKSLTHPFKDSRSAYKSVLGDEPPFTHYEWSELFPEVFGFDIMKDTLDYICFSSDSLQVNAVLEMASEEVIKPLQACPNQAFPSDHLSLKAYFQFPQTTESA